MVNRLLVLALSASQNIAHLLYLHGRAKYHVGTVPSPFSLCLSLVTVHTLPCVSSPSPQVAPTSIRGTLGTLNQLCICLGILGALLANVALPPTAWPTMFTLAALPAVVLGAGGPVCGCSHLPV